MVDFLSAKIQYAEKSKTSLKKMLITKRQLEVLVVYSKFPDTTIVMDRGFFKITGADDEVVKKLMDMISATNNRLIFILDAARKSEDPKCVKLATKLRKIAMEAKNDVAKRCFLWGLVYHPKIAPSCLKQVYEEIFRSKKSRIAHFIVQQKDQAQVLFLLGCKVYSVKRMQFRYKKISYKNDLTLCQWEDFEGFYSFIILMTEITVFFKRNYRISMGKSPKTKSIDAKRKKTKTYECYSTNDDLGNLLYTLLDENLRHFNDAQKEIVSKMEKNKYLRKYLGAIFYYKIIERSSWVTPSKFPIYALRK